MLPFLLVRKFMPIHSARLYSECFPQMNSRDPQIKPFHDCLPVTGKEVEA